jgi:hypothetical protein
VKRLIVLASAGAAVGVPLRTWGGTFSNTATHWLESGNWSPAVVPGAADNVSIVGGTVDMSLTNNALAPSNMTIRNVTFASGSNRTLGNVTNGAVSAVLTLNNGASEAVIDVSGGATFMIAGPNLGVGTGALGLEFGSDGHFKIADNSSLVISSVFGNGGGATLVQNDKLHGGSLALMGNNTYAGSFENRRGKLFLSGADGSLSAVSLTYVRDYVKLDNAINNNNRLSDTSDFRMHCAELVFAANRNAPTTETVGPLLVENFNQITATLATGGAGTGSAWISFPSVQRIEHGGVNFNLQAAGEIDIKFAALPAMEDGILPAWMTTNDSDWAIDNGGVIAANTTHNSDVSPSNWLTTDNVLATGTRNITANKTINTLKLSSSGSVNIADNVALNLDAGGVLATATSMIMGPGDITAGAVADSDLIFHVPDKFDTLYINAPITDNPAGKVNVVTRGEGHVFVNSRCTFTGEFRVTSGILDLGEGFCWDAGKIILGDCGGCFVPANLVPPCVDGITGTGTLELEGPLEVGESDSDSTFDGPVSGSAPLVKKGLGRLVMTGANDLFTGDWEAIGGKLQFTGTDSLGGGHPVLGGGTLELTGAVVAPSRSIELLAAGGTIDVIGSGTSAAFGAIEGASGALTKRGAGVLTAKRVKASGLTVAQGKLAIGANGADDGVSYLGTLSVDSGAGAALDLNDNDLVVNGGNFGALQALVFEGYRSGVDTSATGIVSTTSQTVHGGTTILALFDNSLAGFSDYPFGSGQTISASAIVGKYTYIGDTNMDGQVTPQDYTATDSNLGTSVDVGISWFYGDTNFDGNIDPTDYAGIDGALGLGVGNPLAVNGLAAVPEPGMILGVGLGMLGMRRRRR